MPAIEIKPDIYWIGVSDRTTDLFEGLWPISKEGVTYNSYIVNDEKKAIIDLTKSLKGDDFFSQIGGVTELSSIDYIVVNHMEPDHSGLLRTFRQIAPQAVILGSEKTREFLSGFYGLTDNIRVVHDGDTLNLGKRTLKFISTPFLHWPETIMTYETSQQVLFACDAFGGYGAFHGGIFDDDCKHLEFYTQEALRYYVNIVANYSPRVLAAMDKLSDLTIDVIAPSHGLIWKQNAGTILRMYRKWAEYAGQPGDAGVTLIYGSMYGGTEAMMNAVAEGLDSTGIPMAAFDASRSHPSYILPWLWTRAGVMIGAPTYEVSLFPPVSRVVDMAAHKRIQRKQVAYFGSFGWSGGALRGLNKQIEPLKWELVDTFEFRGFPRSEDLKKGREFGRAFGAKIKDEFPEDKMSEGLTCAAR